MILNFFRDRIGHKLLNLLVSSILCVTLLPQTAFAGTIRPSLDCELQPNTERIALCKKMESIMSFSMGYHGLSPGFSIEPSDVPKMFCKEHISLQDAPALAGMVADYAIDFPSARSKAHYVIGTTATWLMALLGPNALHAFQSKQSNDIFATARNQVINAINNTDFGPGRTYYQQTLECRK